MSFEKNLKELETIVATLEKGDTSLDEAISLFEAGVKLSGKCEKILDGAEQKMKILLKDKDGNVVETEAEQEM